MTTPPADPRLHWRLPALGTLPVIARLDDVVVRILAPNPGPMTLDGTNTYIVGRERTGVAAVVDPGPPDAAHLQRAVSVLESMNARCRWILVTHSHADHAEAAGEWARRLDAQVGAASPSVAGRAGLVLSPGLRLSVGDLAVEVIPTPGHTRDHCAFRLDNDGVLVGDHVLGRGTSVVKHPDGDLAAYLESLRRLMDVGSAALYPGHGPELREDPAAVLRYYIEHREFRQRQIVTLLRSAPHGLTVDEIVRSVYAEVDPRVWPAARSSTQAAIEKLRAEDLIAVAADGTARLL